MFKIVVGFPLLAGRIMIFPLVFRLRLFLSGNVGFGQSKPLLLILLLMQQVVFDTALILEIIFDCKVHGEISSLG